MGMYDPEEFINYADEASYRINNDKLVDAYNEYEKLLNIAEEKDYKHGWIFFKLKDKFGEPVAIRVCRDKDTTN